MCLDLRDSSLALARLVLCSQVPFPAPAPLLLVSTKCSSVLSSQIKRPIATGTSSRWARQGTDRTGTPSDLGRPRPAWFHSRASLFLFFLDNRPPTPDKRHLPVRNCPASFLFSVLFFKYLCLPGPAIAFSCGYSIFTLNLILVLLASSST